MKERYCRELTRQSMITPPLPEEEGHIPCYTNLELDPCRLRLELGRRGHMLYGRPFLGRIRRWMLGPLLGYYYVNGVLIRRKMSYFIRSPCISLAIASRSRASVSSSTSSDDRRSYYIISLSLQSRPRELTKANLAIAAVIRILALCIAKDCLAASVLFVIGS